MWEGEGLVLGGNGSWSPLLHPLSIFPERRMAQARGPGLVVELGAVCPELGASPRLLALGVDTLFART